MLVEQLQPRIKSVADLYENHPYPYFGRWAGFFQRIRWEERQTLNYKALFAAAWGSAEGAVSRPRILVAGCGTLEPLVVALANPQAEVVGVDLSARSLAILKHQATLRGLRGRIHLVQADIQNLPQTLGLFDLVIATGLIHHLPDPRLGLERLIAQSRERAPFRFMIYSRWGRFLLYSAKELAAAMGVKSPRAFRRLIQSLPADHPYRIFFHLYSDSRTDGGLADGFLHPCDQPFTALDLKKMFSEVGLELAAFLHGPEGQPEAASAIDGLPDSADPWQRVSLLDAFGELQENFRLVARREGPCFQPEYYEWNEALPQKGRLYSKRLGKDLVFDRRIPPMFLSEGRIRELVDAMFLVPMGGAISGGSRA